jgi:hypothetical protein
MEQTSHQGITKYRLTITKLSQIEVATGKLWYCRGCYWRGWATPHLIQHKNAWLSCEAQTLRGSSLQKVATFHAMRNEMQLISK